MCFRTTPKMMVRPRRCTHAVGKEKRQKTKRDKQSVNQTRAARDSRTEGTYLGRPLVEVEGVQGGVLFGVGPLRSGPQVHVRVPAQPKHLLLLAAIAKPACARLVRVTPLSCPSKNQNHPHLTHQFQKVQHREPLQFLLTVHSNVISRGNVVMCNLIHCARQEQPLRTDGHPFHSS